MGLALSIAITSVIAPILVGITMMVLNRRYKAQPDRMEAVFLAAGLSAVSIAIAVVLVIVGIANFDWGALSSPDSVESSVRWKAFAALLAFLAAWALFLLPIVIFVSLVRYRDVTPQQHAVHKKLAAEHPGARIVRVKPFTLKWTPRGADKARTAAFDERGLYLKPQEQAAFEKHIAIDPRASIVKRDPLTLEWTPEGADKPVRAAFDEQGRIIRRGRAASRQDPLRSGEGAIDFTGLLGPKGRDPHGPHGPKQSGGRPG